MLPDKKIIAFDLDGTLAVSKSSLSVPMSLLLKNLLKEKRVAIISGGKFEQFEKQVLSVLGGADEYNIENLIILPTNGSQRYEYNRHESVWQMMDKEPLEDAVKEKVKKLLQEVINSDNYDIPQNPKGEIIEDRDTQISFSALGQLAQIAEKELWDPNQEKRQKIKAWLDPQVPEVTVAIGGTTTIDIVKKGFNKAVGLNRCLDKLGMTKSDILFVGDAIFPGGNDYSPYEAGMDVVKVANPEETSEILQNWLG